MSPAKPAPLGISIAGIIERLFRFIEMTIIAALIGVAMRIASPGVSEWLANGLALAAGLYLAIPAAGWITSRYRRSEGSSIGRWAALAGASLVLGLFAVEMTSGLRILISQTFQIDERAARIEYQLWKAHSHLSDCNGGPKGRNPPAKNIPACELRWAAEIQRLEAERHALK